MEGWIGGDSASRLEKAQKLQNTNRFPPMPSYIRAVANLGHLARGYLRRAMLVARRRPVIMKILPGD
jgi:hypothetical protein